MLNRKFRFISLKFRFYVSDTSTCFILKLFCYSAALEVRLTLTFMAFVRPCPLPTVCLWIPCWQYVHQPGAGCDRSPLDFAATTPPQWGISLVTNTGCFLFLVFFVMWNEPNVHQLSFSSPDDSNWYHMFLRSAISMVPLGRPVFPLC